MQTWQPTTPFEVAFDRAHREGDLTTCLAMLRPAELALPISAAAAQGSEPASWAIAPGADRTWILAFTSVEAMVAGSQGEAQHARICSLPELAAGWPDPTYGLAVNPGLPCPLTLEPGTVARLAAPSMTEDMQADPEADLPVVQRLIRPAEVPGLVQQSAPRLSGYVHPAVDVDHIATPAVLVQALGHPDESYIDDNGSVFLVRWPAVGSDLYRSPYGGIDAAGRDAVAGWVIEEAPFVGLGYAPNPDQIIREYKVSGVGLPHGTEVWELGFDGSDRRRFVFDADRRRWMVLATETDWAGALDATATSVDPAPRLRAADPPRRPSD